MGAWLDALQFPKYLSPTSRSLAMFCKQEEDMYQMPFPDGVRCALLPLRLCCLAACSEWGDEAHGLFGFFTPADNSASESNGDDR